MKAYLMLTVFLVFTAFFAMPTGAAEINQTEEFSKLKTLHREISLLNLVNGLYLSDEQIEGLLEILGEVDVMQQEYKAELEKILPELESAYTALHSDLVDDDLVDKQVESKAARIHRIEVELKHSYEEEIAYYEKEAESTLTDKQISLIDDFKPCLIPPKKAGQASLGQAGAADSRVEQMLQRVRKMPEYRFIHNAINICA